MASRRVASFHHIGDPLVRCISGEADTGSSCLLLVGIGAAVLRDDPVDDSWATQRRCETRAVRLTQFDCGMPPVIHARRVSKSV